MFRKKILLAFCCLAMFYKSYAAEEIDSEESQAALIQSEPDGIVVGRILSRCSSVLLISQPISGNVRSVVSCTALENIPICFNLFPESLEALIESEIWNEDTNLKKLFIEKYTKLILNNVKQFSCGTIRGIFFDAGLFKTGEESLMQYCRDEYEKKVLKKYLELPETRNISLSDLKKRKANMDMFGCQLLVEEIKEQKVYDLINAALLYYFDVYKSDANAIKDCAFLYVLMRMLIDHPGKLGENIKSNLHSILQALGKTYSADSKAGNDIYDWLYQNKQGSLGEYHI